MKTTKEPLSETQLDRLFESLLAEFEAIWQKSPKDHTKFAALKNKASNAALTFRQKDGIIERCNNVINGTYGNSKRPEHYGQSKVN